MRYWLWLIVVLPLWAQAEGKVTLTWNQNNPVVGEPLELVVAGEDLPEIFGIQMDIALEGVGIQDEAPIVAGDIWPSDNTMELRNTADEGTARWAFSLLRPADPISGKGVLARQPVGSDQPGEVQLRVEELKFGTEEGEVLKPEVVLPEQPLTIYASQEDIRAEALPAKWIAGGIGVAIALLAAAAWLWRKRKTGP